MKLTSVLLKGLEKERISSLETCISGGRLSAGNIHSRKANPWRQHSPLELMAKIEHVISERKYDLRAFMDIKRVPSKKQRFETQQDSMESILLKQDELPTVLIIAIAPVALTLIKIS